MLNAAALAAILDPERKVPGWWQVFCPMCLKEMLPASKNVCEHCDIKAAVVFTGPATLHTAREHNWRLEDWIFSQSNDSTRYRITQVRTGTTIEYRTTPWDGSHSWACIANDPNHTAALVAAIERIANEQKG